MTRCQRSYLNQHFTKLHLFNCIRYAFDLIIHKRNIFYKNNKRTAENFVFIPTLYGYDMHLRSGMKWVAEITRFFFVFFLAEKG